MASRKPALKVVVTNEALLDLRHIWNYSNERWGQRQADRYELFLWRQLKVLKSGSLLGKVVSSDSNIRYITLRWRTGADGHVAVYKIDVPAMEVYVLHIFHTKQDWREKLDNEA